MKEPGFPPLEQNVNKSTQQSVENTVNHIEQEMQKICAIPDGVDREWGQFSQLRGCITNLVISGDNQQVQELGDSIARVLRQSGGSYQKQALWLDLLNESVLQVEEWALEEDIEGATGDLSDGYDDIFTGASASYSEKIDGFCRTIRSAFESVDPPYFVQTRIDTLVPQVDSEQVLDYPNLAQDLDLQQLADMKLDLSAIEMMDFVYLHKSDVIDSVQNDFGISLLEVPLRERLYILSYFKDRSREQLSVLRDFVDQFGIQGMRAFLATASEDFEMEPLLFAVKNASPSQLDDMKIIFGQYVRILDDIDSTMNEFSREQAHQGDVSGAFVVANKRLLSRAAALLGQYSNQVLDGNSIHESVIGELIDVRAANMALTEMYKALKVEGVVNGITDFEKVESKQYDKVPEGVRDLFEDNYESDRAADLYNDLVMDSEKPGFQLHTVEFDRQIVSAMYEYAAGEGRVYLGGLNMTAREDLRGLPGGQALLEQVFNQHKEAGHVIEASATMRNAERYMNQYGFVLTGTVELSPDEQDEDGLYFGDQIYTLEMQPGQEYDSRSEKYSRTEIKEMAESGRVDADGRIVVWQTMSETQPPQQLNEGYVCTQTFRSAAEDRRYFLLEKTQEEGL